MDSSVLKDVLFLVFSAGYEAGYGGKVDIAKAFNDWYEVLVEIGTRGAKSDANTN